MTCAHAYLPVDAGERTFTIDASAIAFGRGSIAELGEHARGLGAKRLAVFTDRAVRKLPIMEAALKSLADAGIDVVVYDEVKIEPTDASFLAAAGFAREGRFDTYVSIGGGSVIDTCKAAILFATHPADVLTYVNKPVGAGQQVPGPLPHHIACPTTSGTGSELTGIAVCDVLSLKAKTGIASRRLRPSLALIDPDATITLPANVVAASGFDVLCHALESYTARPYTARPAPAKPAERPMSQGRNPWSDAGAREALRLGGQFLVRAVRDAGDAEAREQLMWAATLAGIAFGNAGVHVPHAMAYAVAGLVKDYKMPSYPEDAALIPHGISVVVNAPAAFRWTASACPDRHIEAAWLLGEDRRGVTANDAGPALSRALDRLMNAAGVPRGLDSIGYSDADVDALAAKTSVQRRLLDNAPKPVADADLVHMFRDAMQARGLR